MDTGKLLEQQSAKIGKYVVTAIALDDRCNSFKVTVKSGENWFEETVGLFDFIDVKKKLREGKKLGEMNGLSLLFLKMMIFSKNEHEDKVVELSEVPWRKIIRGEGQIDKLRIALQDEPVKALALLLSKHITLIIPKMLADIPNPGVSRIQQTSRVQQIKKIFYDTRKETDFK